ncbi:MAG: glycoside hydrolase domain-containing protein [Bacteroidaceae bacterium]
MKKMTTWALALLTVLSAQAQAYEPELADPKPGAQETWNTVKNVTLQWGSTDVRYSRSQPATGQKTLTLDAWRGERVSAQAVLSTPVDLARVTFEVSDLRNGKALIPASAINKYFVRYVMTDWHENMADSFLLPDHLSPDTEMKVAAHTTRPLWLDIRVPQDAKPGTYKGTLTVSCDGQTFTLPLSLQVCSRVLPAPSEWAFHLDLWQNPFAVARYFNVPLWSKAHFDHMRPIMKLLADAGEKVITCSIIQHPWNCQTYDPFESMIAKMKQIDGTWKYDYTVFDKWVQFMMDCGIDKQIDCYTLVPWHYVFDYYDCATNSTKMVKCEPKQAEYRDLVLPFLKDFAAHLKAKGWFARTCIAMDERPMDQLQAAWDIVKEADPDYRIEGAMNYKVGSTGLIDKMHDISILYHDAHVPLEYLNTRRANGQKTTFYTCCAPDRPNTFTFSDPAESAYIGWHAFTLGFDGYLRWAYNSWTPRPCQDSRFVTWSSGDCFLAYPTGSSIRMERLVEGIQAYEKLRILQPTLTPAQQKQLEQALDPFRPVAYDTSVDAAQAVNSAKAVLRKLSGK